MRFQRVNLIESATESSDSDNLNDDTLKLMESSNPFAKLSALYKVKNIMNFYGQAKLGQADKNLIRGIFIRKIKDFKEDYVEKFRRKSLTLRM
jgi:hypothetical protein